MVLLAFSQVMQNCGGAYKVQVNLAARPGQSLAQRCSYLSDLYAMPSAVFR